MDPDTITFEEPLMLIGGELRPSVTERIFSTTNPATGEEIAQIPRGSNEDVELAVEAAKSGFQTWHTEYSVQERADALREYASLLRDNAEHFASLDAADGGNPYGSMLGDVESAATTAETMADFALELKGDTIPVSNDTLDYTVHQPYGVVARILPFNHPFMFSAGKLAAPLLAGNSIVLKPPEQASLSSLELARLIEDQGVFPDGVVNILTGFGAEVGAPLVEHEEVRKVGFIGSVETGRTVMKSAAETITDITLELGGKNPCVVYPNANLHDAIDSVVGAMNFTWCSGQSCGSTSRLFLHEDLYEDGLALLADEIAEIRDGMGDPLDEETRMGTVISEDQYEKVMSYIEAGKESDATLLCGGGHPEGAEFENGYFVEPTVFSDVTMDMKIAREEIFGPVLSVLEWSDEDEMIEQANELEYGLTASIFTNDVSTAHQTAQRIESGYVWINQAGPHYIGAPFGGWKQSGIGKEEAVDEVLSFMRTKNVNLKL